MSLKNPMVPVLKTLLKSTQNGPRNYASVIGVFPDKQSLVWTDGFSILKVGKPDPKPSDLLTLKDLELMDMDGTGLLEPHHLLSSRPRVSYPSYDKLKFGKPRATIAIDAKRLEKALELVRKLSQEKEVSLSISKDGMITISGLNVEMMVAGNIESKDQEASHD